ncbi:hypothetical protein ACM55M_12120 [Flavobacterium sp. ZT3R25]|uniref:hypothetical protein n=1 Tax=Flavobacterium galactosi TaxID=3398735 RepID=UPI003A8ACB21
MPVANNKIQFLPTTPTAPDYSEKSAVSKALERLPVKSYSLPPALPQRRGYPKYSFTGALILLAERGFVAKSGNWLK